MKKKLIAVVSVFVLTILAVLGMSGCAKTKMDPKAVAYKVLQLTDIHLLNNEKDNANLETADMLIKETKPDLIMVTGDVTSEKVNFPPFKKFCEFIETYKIPWDFTFGNHDAEGDTDKETMSEYLETLEYCVYERGDAEVFGYGNHFINVKNKEGNVVNSLIMMDSNMYGPKGYDSPYDKFHGSQIEWYEKTVKAIAAEVNGSEDKVVPSLAFFHIPMREFTAAYDEASGSEKVLYGSKMEAECSPYEDDMMFEKMVELQSTKGVFVGHDHMNSYAVEYQGIRLTYGYSTDHNIYIVLRRGGTLISIKNDGTFVQQGVYRDFGKGSLKFTDEV